jgi:ATP-dependent Clp protease ATP-binding subunit ClpC
MDVECIKIDNFPNVGKYFTDDAVGVVCNVLRVALQCQVLGRLPPVLLLLSLLGWKRKVGRAALESCGVTADVFIRDIRDLFAQFTSDSPGLLIDFSEVHDVVRGAYEQARGLGVTYVGTEHLALALACSPNQTLQRLFQQRGITYALLRSKVLEILGEREER